MDIEETDLCVFCSDLIKATNDSPAHPSQRHHHATYGSLLSSSKSCIACQLIVSLWSHLSPSLISHGLSYETFKNSQEGYRVEVIMKENRRMQSGVCWVFLQASLASTDTDFRFISYFTITTCLLGEDPASALPVWKTPATTFDEKLATIRSWMQECHSGDGHSDCRPTPYAPLRLIAIHPNDGPLKLVQQDSTTNPTKYATLSYCWGKSLQLRTTKATLTRFTEKIPSELIPKTWTDAIHIARALRIPRIWIDALCIVQDDEAEWQQEAGHMSEIYQGSLLTIAAAQSADSLQGCFPSGAHGLENGDLFFRTRLDGLNGRISLVRFYRSDIRDSAVSGTAISSRGWTLQEQLLSPRLVHCMQPEIHWQCRAGYQTQSGLSFGLALKGSNILVPHQDLGTGDQQYRSAWRRIIESYSLREFSYSRDRIPAIAGITRNFSTVLDDVPILGLWRKSFARDLAWLRGGGPPQMSDTTGLPSWTWFTCQGCVLYTVGGRYANQNREVMENLELLGWNVQWQGVPLTSPISSAQVRVRGPVREIRIVPFAEGNRYVPPYFQVFEEILQPTAERRIPWRCAGQFDVGEASVAATYLCLQLLSESRKSNFHYVREVFLILKPVEIANGMGMNYKRVGLARIWGETPTFDSTNTMSMVLV
ncbi:heterokaryon incompatibility protein-domain-containing protein [Schizothecium vesticola]|uniref:Heterokaryon incompatibility protein-domain-containing protein n=1 Tax=Schizothecium vesticola TaxID=314040 RepID=A0AA40EJ68_9PEZI|nr:heterokaryon incompatibility protein-domain-containing protein [Schizothecium vesticola]